MTAQPLQTLLDLPERLAEKGKSIECSLFAREAEWCAAVEWLRKERCVCGEEMCDNCEKIEQAFGAAFNNTSHQQKSLGNKEETPVGERETEPLTRRNNSSGSSGQKLPSNLPVGDGVAKTTGSSSPSCPVREAKCKHCKKKITRFDFGKDAPRWFHNLTGTSFCGKTDRAEPEEVLK